MKKAGVLQALSDRLQNSRLVVIDDFGLPGRPSTKVARLRLEAVAPAKGAQFLVALSREQEQEALSLRNLKTNVHMNFVDQLNTYDILNSDYVVFTEAAFRKFEEILADREAGDGVRAGAVPRAKDAELLEKGYEDGQDVPISINLLSALQSADVMTNVQVHAREDSHLEAASLVTDGIDPVAIERHDGFVLVSWPTVLDATAAIAVLQAHASSAPHAEEVTLYAGSDDVSIDHEDGDVIDWTRLLDLAGELNYVRLELATQTFVWTRPEGPHEHENRFVTMATTIGSDDLFNLMDETQSEHVVPLFRDVLGAKPWKMDGISASA